MSNLRQARWESTQERFKVLEKQIKLLFKLVKEKKKVEDPFQKLPPLAKEQMKNLARELVITKKLDPVLVSEAFDWIVHFYDAHREL